MPLAVTDKDVDIQTTDCVEILKSELGHENFSLIGFEVSRFEQALSFQATFASLKIRATVSEEEKKFTFFVKIQNENPEAYQKYWKHTGQFQKERFFMTTVVKELQKFVDRKITAACHLSKLDEFLVMDDLTVSGFERSRTALLDVRHLEKAVEAFATFHAASILFEERTGNSVKEKFSDIDFETVFFSREGLDDCWFHSIEKALKAVSVKYLIDWTDEKRSWLFETVKEVILTAFTNPKHFKSVICQGDPWGNNILYKYNPKSEPVNAILIDFGCLRFGPPTLDLMQFMYVGTSKDIRNKFKSHIQNVYYKYLTDILTSSGLNAYEVFPKAQFTESCDYYERFGVAVRLYYNFITLLPAMYIEKMIDTVDSYLGLMIYGDASLPLEACEKDENYRKSIVSLFEETFQYFNSTINGDLLQN